MAFRTPSANLPCILLYVASYLRRRWHLIDLHLLSRRWLSLLVSLRDSPRHPRLLEAAVSVLMLWQVAKQRIITRNLPVNVTVITLSAVNLNRLKVTPAFLLLVLHMCKRAGLKLCFLTPTSCDGGECICSPGCQKWFERFLESCRRCRQ